jgi:NTE family protein
MVEKEYRMSGQNVAEDTEVSRFVDLVLEGGGVRGNALIGALAVLEERRYQPQNLAGTSAGAIVATGLAAGYSAPEMREIIENLDFRQFMDRGWEDRVPVLGGALSILKDQGIYEGARFLDWMTSILEKKGVRTFRDLVHPAYASEPRYRYKVRVIASDITQRCLLALPQDAVKLGVEPDDLSVALAVRMSMSIPIFFEPVRFTNPKTGRDHLIVDGGMLSNFPIWLFDSPGEPEWPTFGLRLAGDPTEDRATSLDVPTAPTNQIAVVLDFIKSLIQTMVDAHDRLYLDAAAFARTISIPTLGVGGTDFNLSKETALALYQSGYTAAEEFLKSWDFEAYKVAFRSGKQAYGRRQEVVDYMLRVATG